MLTHHNSINRRRFLAMTAALPLASVISVAPARIPIGLELFSVRDQLKQDLPGTLRAVAGMGYAGVEFFAPYFEWTPAYAKDVRKLLDDLNLRCYSTHNSSSSFDAENIPHAVELNRILGSQYIVMASTGKIENIDGWKAVAEKLNRAAEKFKLENLKAGFHNHQIEFTPIEGRRPIEILAANTDKDIMLQLDVGTCLEAKSDPVEWINRNRGRIVSIHCKDWSPDPAKGYKILFGEGAARWKAIFNAAETNGGIQYYLMEQEGSAYPAFETAERCLAAYKQLRAA